MEPVKRVCVGPRCRLWCRRELGTNPTKHWKGWVITKSIGGRQANDRQELDETLDAIPNVSQSIQKKRTGDTLFGG